MTKSVKMGVKVCLADSNNLELYQILEVQAKV